MSKFDDIGDMLAYHARHPELEVRARFVHDYNTEECILGETAFYVRSSQIVSPMGHGIAAFRDRSAAETFAGGIGASVLTFDALRAAR
ncbi:MAG TPA: nitrous oxide reductase accessory protein NosL [Anaerolineae bacterium]|nr:nitrous oxide reductase accessory protein NosL [Anaerolineae bacterium]